MGKKKQDMGRKIIVFLATAMLTGVFSFIIGMMLTAVKGMGGDWVNSLQILVAGIIMVVAMWMRKGKESVAESLPTVFFITAFYEVLDKLVSIPFLRYSIEWSWEGIALAFATVWLAESVVQKFV